MILALLWLTVSAPFIAVKQQELNKSAQTTMPFSAADDEAANPFGNSTEEKAPSTTTLSEEFLHDSHLQDHFFSIILPAYSHISSGTYVAFHGELLVPPPNVA